MADNPQERAALARQQAEHRAIMQATMQAQRAGKLPGRPKSSGGEAVTAIGVVVVVLATLFLAVRYGG